MQFYILYFGFDIVKRLLSGESTIWTTEQNLNVWWECRTLHPRVQDHRALHRPTVIAICLYIYLKVVQIPIKYTIDLNFRWIV